MDTIRLIQLTFAAVLGFASVVEWAHLKQFLGDALSGDLSRLPFVVATGGAAVATGFMAAEALRGEWPSW